jgi:beta-lactamase class A
MQTDHRRALITAVVMIILIVPGLLWFSRETDEAVTESEPPVAEEPVEQEAPQTPEYSAEEVSQVLQSWAQNQSGQYGVTILDDEGELLAETNGEQVFFAASIYKLYVAYAGYQKIDDGTYSGAEPYLNGKTRLECLIAMIEVSDSPCAEKMWIELGRADIDRQLESYGVNNTSMLGVTTSSRDAALLLARLHQGLDLSTISREKFLQSLEDQIYRDALPEGFDETATVRNKVGFREQDEYHDVAIVEMRDGRVLIVSVLTNGVGPSNIARLGTLLSEL